MSRQPRHLVLEVGAVTSPMPGPGERDHHHPMHRARHPGGRPPPTRPGPPRNPAHANDADPPPGHTTRSGAGRHHSGGSRLRGRTEATITPSSSSKTTRSTTLRSTPSNRCHTLANRTPFHSSRPSLPIARIVGLGRRVPRQPSSAHPRNQQESPESALFCCASPPQRRRAPDQHEHRRPHRQRLTSLALPPGRPARPHRHPPPTTPPDRPRPPPRAQRATEDSLRRQLEALRAAHADLVAENNRLREALARKLGQQRTAAIADP